MQNTDTYRQKAESTGNMEFMDIVVDSERCSDLAGLTAHQKLVTSLRWTVGLTLEESGRLLCCSAEAVRQSEEAAKKKLQTVLVSWGKQT